jgi:cyclophilin family peptidyl-prolyl cis-trans isomerase
MHFSSFFTIFCWVLRWRVIGITAFMGVVVVSCRHGEESERLRRFAAAPKEFSSRTVFSLGEESNSTAIDDEAEFLEQAGDTTPHATHRAEIRTTLGNMTIHLFGKDAPLAVGNFVKLAERKFFRGMLIHRVARDFVIQTGDPKTKDKRKKDEWGTGGESAFGTPFPDELAGESPSRRRGYKRGVVAMANRSPDANTSQFFICLRDVPELPPRYTIFGELVAGFDVLDSIGRVPIIPQLNENDGRPVKAIVIKSVTVEKLRFSRPVAAAHPSTPNR